MRINRRFPGETPANRTVTRSPLKSTDSAMSPRLEIVISQLYVMTAGTAQALPRDHGAERPRIGLADSYLVDVKPGFRDGQLHFPLGAIQGQKFDLALRELTLPVSATEDFDRLPIPFRAVATDIANGQAVVIGNRPRCRTRSRQLRRRAGRLSFPQR